MGPYENFFFSFLDLSSSARHLLKMTTTEKIIPFPTIRYGQPLDYGFINLM